MRRIFASLLAVTALAFAAGCDPKSPSTQAPQPDFVSATGELPSAAPSVAASPSAAPSPSAVPSPTPSKSRTPKPSTSPTPVSCPQGEYQKAVEQALASLGGYGTVTVDGKQSAADCAAIKKFQKRFDIRPYNGKAGPMTRSVSQRLVKSTASRCAAGSGLTACVDLTNQTVWIMNGGKIVYGPTVTRTGMAGYPTQSGTFKIYDRQLKNWSEEWDVWLPYWQRVVGGSGFHQTTTYIHNSAIGSHGCINLLPFDAVKFWNTLKNGTTVKVFGRRSGT